MVGSKLRIPFRLSSQELVTAKKVKPNPKARVLVTEKRAGNNC